MEHGRAPRVSSFAKALSYPVSAQMEVEEAQPSARYRMAPIDMCIAKLAAPPHQDITPRIRSSNFSMTSYTLLSNRWKYPKRPSSESLNPIVTNVVEEFEKFSLKNLVQSSTWEAMVRRTP